jgi:hypothetical protein
MNETQRKLNDKVDRLTQRLEFAIKDPSRSDAENARASVQLAALTEVLERIVPHPSFSPEERVERLARVVDDATPNPRLMEPEIVKLERLVARVDELMPVSGLSVQEKLDRLGRMFAAAFPDSVNKVG